ncbi:SdiA-regulated domain-containing protein [Pricia sp.]|uniref:SdiA-regulated domain-containing protein n=1 Tax=Pricia sp. TaxID=2268138 RepID=UPI0035934525
MNKMKLWTILGLGLGFILIIVLFTDMAPERNQGGLSFTVSQRWNLPSELDEISGIVYLENGKIAAVQDEDGIIFIYDLNEKKVDREIAFGDKGDYEGLAVNKADAYVLRSDGTIIEIKNFENADRTVNTYRTPFSGKNNVEALELDVERNSLLISPKDMDLGSDRYKGVYGFSLETKKIESEPLFKLDMGDKALKRFRENDLAKTFRPSDLAIHPKTKEIYMLEGSKPKLLILDADGNVKNAYGLDKKMFPQPEGITFDNEGSLYIASEAKKGGNGTITQLKLKE